MAENNPHLSVPEYFVAPFPYHPDEGPEVGVEVSASWSLSIPTGASHPDEAWEFIKFWMLSDEAAMIYGEYTGDLAIRRDNAFAEHLLQESDIYGAFIQYVQMSSPADDPVQGMDRLGQLMDERLGEAYRGQISPANLLAQLQQLVEAEVNKYR